MQSKTTQHKHRTLYVIKWSNKAVKNGRNNKRLYNNNGNKKKKDREKKYMITFSQSQIFIVFGHDN